MALNQNEKKEAIKEAERRGYTKSSDGTHWRKGSDVFKPTDTGGGFKTKNGDYTDLGNLKKSTKW